MARRRERWIHPFQLRVAAALAFALAVVLVGVALSAPELSKGTLLRAGLAGLALALVLSIPVTRRLLSSLRELEDAVVELADGDLARALPFRSDGELGRLAGAIDGLAHELRGRLQEILVDRGRLQAVLAGMVEGVLVIDSDGRIVIANPRLRELFGLWAEVDGRPYWEVLRRAELENALAEARREPEAVLVELDTDPPEPRQLQMHAVRFPANGDPLGVVAVFHDVTEIHRLERVRRDFVANVSHELKTPLTAIRGFAEVLQGDGLTEEQHAQYLEVISRHADRLGRLIEDVLELSRIEGQQVYSEPTDVDVLRMARSAVRDMGPQLASRQLVAEVVAKGEGHAFADRGAVEQILSNLLDNAAKYTEAGGRIEVRVLGEPGGPFRLEVEDDGIGIPEHDQPRIFERFYRVDQSRSRALGGTGLGLAIVKHLVQAQGGEVHLRSTPGRGTVFSVVLPAVERG